MMDIRIAVLVIEYLRNIQKIVHTVIERRRKFLKKLWYLHMKMWNTYSLALGTVIMIVGDPARGRKSSRFWMKERSNHFWEYIVQKQYMDEDWIETFRMRKPVFKYICDMLREACNPSDLFLKSRDPISTEKQVAIALYYLASCCEYRVIGNVFGVHKTSVWRCVHRVVTAIIDILLPIWIKMPDEVECQIISYVYEEKTHIPQIIGCIDGTHIPVLPPSDGYRDYVNRKGWPSIILQCVIDNTHRFRNINCQAPGSAHDANVFRESKLFQFHKRLIPQTTKTVRGVQVPYMIIGDPAYPLLPWLLKGYTKVHQLSPEEESFNVYLNSGRVDVEIAIGRLKARWRRILKRMDVHHTFAPEVVAACCVMHNIVETHKETFKYSWMSEVNDAEILFPQPEGLMSRELDSLDASLIRNALKDLVSQFPLRTSFG